MKEKQELLNYINDCTFILKREKQMLKQLVETFEAAVRTDELSKSLTPEQKEKLGITP